MNANSRGIRIPVPVDPQVAYAQDGTFTPGKTEEIILWSSEISEVVARYAALRPIGSSLNGVAIVGRDIIENLNKGTCKRIPVDLDRDLTTSVQVGGLGVYLSGRANGVTVLWNAPKIFVPIKSYEAKSDGERLCEAALTAAARFVSEYGEIHSGEYQDGWYASLRLFFESIGVELPPEAKFRVRTPKELAEAVLTDWR